MQSKKMMSFFLSLMFLLVLAGSGAAREPYPVGGSGGAQKEGPAITAKGKIKHLGGQFFLASPEVKDSASDHECGRQGIGASVE